MQTCSTGVPGDLLDRHDVVGVVRLGDQRPELAEVDLHALVVLAPSSGPISSKSSSRCWRRSHSRVLSSGGKTAEVAPSSAIMLAIVPRSGTDRSAVPGPVNSKTLFLPPLTLSWRSSSRMMSLACTHGPRELAVEVDLDDLGAGDLVRVAAHRHRHVEAAGADRDHARARRSWWCASRRRPGCRPAWRSARCARSGRCRCPGASSGCRTCGASACSMRWSSGFLKSSWMTLWSTYWTARSTCTRGTLELLELHAAPSCPVASWSSVWSIRSAIGSPGLELALDQVLAQDLPREVLGHGGYATARPVAADQAPCSRRSTRPRSLGGT